MASQKTLVYMLSYVTLISLGFPVEGAKLQSTDGHFLFPRPGDPRIQNREADGFLPKWQ